ncbi:extracellular solute-binding protein [Microbispora sp. ATCC PTA-5024]|uniref:extracellular solute-binding protein n=1 Tax=Microbispora sp. ATCC PTA-5024 TaxID=316330 RepID=UPI0004025824|nr:extracellular solute-binding protein [Microbispora sp. ATCC PTA-5024]
MFRTSERAAGPASRAARKATVVLLTLALLAAAACGVTQRQTLRVFADSSLTGVFGTLARTFEASHPDVAIAFHFGGGPALARRIAQGEAADVLAAAPDATSLVGGATPRVFARDRMEIAVPRGNPAHVAALADLAAPGVRLVLCVPAIPCGASADRALAAAGVTPGPVVRTMDASAALAKVRRGDADAALVGRTDIRAAAGAVDGVDLPASAGAAGEYAIASVPKSENHVPAREFVDLVLSDQGRRVLADAGFSPA